MSRYLTPGKIALLLLVELYAESRFPNSTVLPVLKFVIKHLGRPKDNSTFILGLEEIKAVTMNEPSTVVGRTIFDLLLMEMWHIDSFDTLHSFFAKTQQMLVQDADKHDPPSQTNARSKRRLFTSTSILGCFCRRTSLEFVRLQFNDAIVLWRAFIQFREPTLPLWKKRKLGAGPTSFDSNLMGLTLDNELVRRVYGGLHESKECIVSTDDVERLLEFQVQIMQRLGTRVPEATQAKLAQMLDTNVPVSHLRHYVNFLNSWRSGDYPGSFDSLHRYFDYTMHSRDRTFYQYALLNLAILQADFGCHRESVLAMQETINTARENRDMACLNFALSWLYHFHRAHPQDCPEVIASRMERESLQFLKAKAKEWGMDHLLSMAYLSETKQILSTGESIPSAFESLLRSSHINITQQIHNAIGSQILLQSTLWSRLGVSQLAWSNCELFLSKYKEKSPVEDLVVATCRSAYILSMRGRFIEALELLEQVDHEALRSLKIYQYWAAYIGIIKLRRAVYRSEFAAADLLLQQLASSEQLEPDCALEISISKIELHLRSGNILAAFNYCSQIYAELVRDKADSYHIVRLLTLKAEVFARSGRAMKGLSTAISAASTAWKSRFLPALFHALCVIGGVLNHLEEYGAAYKMLDCIMPQVLECEDVYLTAQCFACLADGQVGIAGTKKGAARTEYLHRALNFIDRAFSEFSRVQDVSSQKLMMSRKVLIYNYLSDKELRANAIKMYRQVEHDSLRIIPSSMTAQSTSLTTS